MLRFYRHSLRCPIAAVLRGKTGWLVRTVIYCLYTLSTTCDAATLSSSPSATLTPTQSRYQQLTEVWREAFPSTDDVLAPSPSIESSPINQPTAPWAGVRARNRRPHPAVARIVVPEQGAISYGSGTLIDVREGFGLVITNWHVVRDASDTIEVSFPNGFNSKARALKVDTDWDLAALVVWRPANIEPVSIAANAPRPGDRLTICGYGQGNYRCATGRCTQYYAPRLDFPRHMVELDVEARQGDSGGPIFNEHGELAGVLFGAGQGTTLGSFGGRVGSFLATLAPDIGRAEQSLAEHTTSPAVDGSDRRLEATAEATNTLRPATIQPHSHEAPADAVSADAIASQDCPWPANLHEEPLQLASNPSASAAVRTPQSLPVGNRRFNLFEQTKTALAAVGLVTIVVQVLRVAR
ncbi:MAG: serine protease [Planctomycetota bacterium]